MSLVFHKKRKKMNLVKLIKWLSGKIKNHGNNHEHLFFLQAPLHLWSPKVDFRECFQIPAKVPILSR
jgi:hypothetical protein